nr:ribonuclease H-like domain-containing protein [Tanacetum cinerariifolium]
ALILHPISYVFVELHILQDFSNFIMNRLRVNTLTPELLAGPTFDLMKGSCTSLIKLEYHLEEVYPEDWITVRRDDDKRYKFKEGDFKRMFTRSIVIQRRMEDLQLGVESYQKRLNLTKPDMYRCDLKQREAYTAYSNPRGFIYQNKDKKNRLIRINELYKFSDETLNDVRNALDDHLKGIRMHYLPQTIRRKGDKGRAAAMIQAIDKMLKTRRIMRSLERRGTTETDIKRIDADDQAIQTILLGLPEDVYAAVDSCETTKEIWERVRQMMKGLDIREQEKKAKLFNEWEKFTSTDEESIESYYHWFMQLMNDLKRNKHFPKNIASFSTTFNLNGRDTMLEEMAGINLDNMLVKWYRINKVLMHGRRIQGAQNAGLRVLEMGIKPCATTVGDWAILLGIALSDQGERMLLIFKSICSLLKRKKQGSNFKLKNLTSWLLQLLDHAPHSPEYVPNLIELEDHVPAHIPKHPKDLVLVEDEAPIEAYIPKMRAVVPSTYHSLLPSGTPSLLPIPLPVPSTSRRADILEADTPPRKRLLLTTPRPGCEVGESSAAAARQPVPTMARSVDCSFVDTTETRFRDTKRRMMTALEMVNIMKDRAVVRAEIEILRRERLTYEQESIQTRKALARSEAYSRTLEARHIMRTQALEAGARIDTLEDTKKMAPKRTTRSTTDQETTNTISVTNAQLQAMINQGISAALAARDALRSTNGDDSHNSGMVSKI